MTTHSRKHDAEQPLVDDALSRVFGIDVRSLALLRVALGAIVLADLCIRAGDLPTFYTDAGLLPRAAWLRTSPGSISLHAAGGSAAFVAVLFAAHACSATMMLVGWHTRIATFVTWALTVSLQARAPSLLQGGDTLLVLLLFWSLFVPLGAAFSVDASWRPRAGGARSAARVLSIGTAAMTLQMPFVYFFTGLLKNGAEWRSTFTAVQRALGDDFISSPAGAWLARELPANALGAVTASVIVLELAIPVLLMSPWRTAKVRSVLIVVLFGLQLGFLCCLRIGLFPFISTAATFALVPGRAWDGIAARTARVRAAARLRLSRAIGAVANAASPLVRRVGTSRPMFRLGRLGTAACALALAFGVVDNVASVAETKILPASVNRIGKTLKLHQTWKMFVRSGKSRRWVVLAGTLEDGTRVDLMPDASGAPSLARPEHISDTFKNYRWRKYFGNVSNPKKAERQRRSLAEYLCRSHNAGKAPGERLESIVAYRFDEAASAEPGSVRAKRTKLFTKQCTRSHDRPRFAPELEPRAAL